MKDDCIRIFEYLNYKEIIYIFRGMENLMQPVYTINLKEEYINPSFIRKDIKYIISLFLFNQTIEGE